MSEQNGERFSERFSLEETKELLRELHVESVTNQFSNRVLTLVVASLGLTTALAWDETLRELFHAIFGASETLIDKLFYSLTVTALAVLMTVFVAKLLPKEPKK